MNGAKRDEGSKIRSACDACRTRKLKCSGESDGCSRCRTLGLKCHFSAQLPSGRPSKRKAGCLDDGFSSILELGGSENAAFVGSTGNPAADTGLFDTASSIGSWPPQEHDFENIAIPDFLTPGFTSGSVMPTDLGSLIIGGIDSGQTPQCICSEMAQGCLSTLRGRDAKTTSLDLLQKLRQSRAAVETLLDCKACFQIDMSAQEGSANILSLGYLMTSIAVAYADFFKAVSATAEAGASQQFTIGDPTVIGSQMQVELSGDKYRDFMCSAFRGEIEMLSSLCDRFRQRQWHRHSQGHEQCKPGQPCLNPPPKPSRDPTEACPHQEDPSQIFPCFSIVGQAAIAIRRVQRIMG